MFLSARVASCQGKDEIVLKLNIENYSFERFASLLTEEYDIRMLYRDEWVSDLKVNCKNDSITLPNLLTSLFETSGINFYRHNKHLYYVTGPTSVRPGVLPADPELGEAEVPDDDIISQFFMQTENLATNIKSVVIGSEDNPESGRVNISGRVISASSAEPVIGVTVFVSGTNNAVITNKDGFYILREKAGTEFTLQFSCLGMKKDSILVSLNGSGTLNMKMEDQLIAIQDIVVRAGKYDNVRGIQMGFQKIDIKAIESIPAIFGEKDILKVAQMLPGVQTVGEGASGFNVRGSGTDQNLFIINEIPVLNTGHLLGFFSSFNPDMIRDFNLYKNNFPAEFGGRLSSVFEISTKKGNKKEFGARGAVSPVTASLLFETPIIKDKASFILGGRSTYSNWILSRVDHHDVRTSRASFYDLMSGFHFADDKNSIQIFGYHSNDDFLLSRFNDNKYQNSGVSVIYNRTINKEWLFKLAGVWSDYKNRQSYLEFPQSSSTHLFEVSSKELKAKLTTFSLLRNKISVGGNIIEHNLNHGVFSPLESESLLSPIDLGNERGIEAAVFIDDEIELTDKLTIYAGLRFSFYKYMGPNKVINYLPDQPFEEQYIVDTTFYSRGEKIFGNSAPEPRLSLNYNFRPDMSLKFSYNRMYQYIFMLTNTVAISPTDRWKLVGPFIKPPLSDQISLGFYRNYNRFALETSFEVYAKKSKNIVEYQDGVDVRLNPNYESMILNGDQEVYGAELMIKRNAGRITGWVSYTYARSMITVNGENDWQQINSGVSYPSNYDKPHAFVAVGNYKVSRRLSLSSNLVYNSGRPITYPSGIIYLNGEKTFIYSNRNEYRIPDYFRIDLSLNLEGNLLKNKNGHGAWMFSVYNLTGRRNAYSIYFRENDGKVDGYKLSIFGVPIFTVSYSFKLGNYATD